MKGKDNIKELFSEKLGNYEAKVNPELWSGVSSQIGTTAAQTAAGGMTLLTKSLIGLGLVAATIVSVVLITNNNKEVVKDPVNEPKVVQTEVTTEEENEQNKATPPVSVQPEESEQTLPVEQEATVDVPEEYPLHEPISIVTLPVEDFDERVTREDEPVNMLPEEVNEGEDVPEKSAEPEEVITEEEAPEEMPMVEPEVKTEISLPNAFTPNSDNRNDFYEIIEGADNLSDFSVFIYNMTGEIVYRSDNPHFKWDGNDLRQEPVPTGKYMCVIIATDVDGNPQKVTKQFDLFR